MSANGDLMWPVCFDLYVRWSDFLQAKFLAHVIKFKSCFTLFIRIKGFFTFTGKLTLIFCQRLCDMCDMWYGCNVIYYVKQLHHFKVRYGEQFGNFYFTDKKVRVDNNQNNSKMPIMLRSVDAVSNGTLQIIVQFYFFNPLNASSYFNVFCQRSSP